LLRDELKAEDEDVLVGIVGRLTEVKNHSLFLRAAARLKEKTNLERAPGRVRFVIIGDGQLRTQLEDEARALGLSDDVVFLGTRNDPENFYAALDVVALTSLNEGTPLTLIEAMANARACVATAVGGVVDLLGEKSKAPAETGGGASATEDKGWTICERGVRVRSQDAVAFSDALLWLIEGTELRNELGARSSSFVEQNYSKERLLTDVLKLYRELAGESLKSKAQSPKSKIKEESSTLDLGL
jgi:glycosyltransferase involved in cell wall biosynthesis